MRFLREHVSRHRLFYISAVLGAVSWGAAAVFDPSLRLAVAGDTFFGADIILMMLQVFKTSADDLRSSAQVEDEGVYLIVLLTVTAIAFSLTSIFTLLNQGGKPNVLRLALSIASAPLGWFMLHTISAFHYAHLYYFAGGSDDTDRRYRGGLKFPDTDTPGIWDFLYYSFVVGMTAQVSDVQVVATPMRKLTLAHSIVSFFFNTVLIALAVNVAVALG